MANEPSTIQGKSTEKPQPQRIPLEKIHDLPGTFIPKQPDRSYGGLVSSIQAIGVTEAVILRQREDGEYQLLAGYRRRRASELAKKQDIPALVYEMTMQEALSYHQKQKTQPDTPVPGKLLPAPAPAAPVAPKQEEAKATEGKKAEAPAPAAPTPPKPEEAKATESKKAEAPAPAAPTPPKPEEAKAAESKKAEVPAPAAPTPPKQEKAKATEGKKAEAPVSAAPAAPKQEAKATEGKKAEAPVSAVPAAPKQEAKATEGKKAETPAPAAPAAPKQEAKATESKKAEAPAPAVPPASKAGEGKDDKGKTPDTPPVPEVPGIKKEATGKVEPSPNGKSGKVVEFPKVGKERPAAAPVGPAAAGPTGTAITQVFDARLNPPTEKELRDIPMPGDGESYFITLHPGYLEKSKFNTFSVDRDSENFKELYKAIELTGIKDPVLARPKLNGGLEILSGQRRHMIGSELNYPIPTIIQVIDDDDAKIMVADSNLHRDKISSYDLSRALRMKADGMKRKAGRRRKSDPSLPLLNTNGALAKEMGMPVSKLDRIIRLSEATKEVCSRYDDGSLELSIAYALSFLKPQTQDMAMHLSDLGYKVSTVRVERMKKAEKAGKLTEQDMRDILDDKDIAPKAPPAPPAKPVPATPTEPPAPATSVRQAPNDTPAVSESPAPTSGTEKQPATAAVTQVPATEPDIFKGAQERPENVKVILTGDRLRRYYPDVTMTPREIEEDIYDKLDRCRKMDERQAAKEQIFKKNTPSR